MLNIYNTKTATVLTVLLSVLTITPILPVAPVAAKPLQAQRVNNGRAVIPSGTAFPVRYEEGKRILMAKNETVPLTLEVARDIRDSRGKVVIPAGSQIAGQLQPSGRGARFVAKNLILNYGNEVPINATSNVITRTETIKKGANPKEILGGTVAGAGAAAIISGLTGDRNINALEVITGAALGTIAGWALPETGVIGGGSKDVLSIDPDRDLTLTLRSDLYVNRNDYRY